MKNKILLFSAFLLLGACADDDSTTVDNPQNEIVTGNKVLLLKVDLTNSTFEGGKELSFEDHDAFTISPVYNVPGDFGDITLKYAELDQPIFAGTIHWMGLGEMTYPEALTGAEEFEATDVAVPMPAQSDFEIVEYDGLQPYFIETLDYNAIWNAIDNLQIVSDYRATNPDAKVRLFLYSPSVGVGNPLEWDWYVIFKN
jgi:hypothetical protein